MALTGQNETIIRDLMTEAEELLRWRERAEGLIARFNLNDTYNQSSDTDVAAKFPHLTQGEIGNGINAFKVILVALGADAGGGTPVRNDTTGKAADLIKLKA